MDRPDWNERYGGGRFVWTTEPNRFLVAEVADIAPGRALDVACGEGRNAVWLAERGWDVTAVDFSPVGLSKARRLARNRGVEVDWVEADVIEWDPPAEAFSLVIVFYLHLRSDDRRKAMSHAQDALAPGGTILLVGHDATNVRHGYGGPQDPAVLYTPEQVAHDLVGLRILRADQVRRDVETDEGHHVAIDALVRAVKPSTHGADPPNGREQRQPDPGWLVTICSAGILAAASPDSALSRRQRPCTLRLWTDGGR